MIDNKLKAIKADIDKANAQLEPFKTGGAKLVTEAELAKQEQQLKKW